MSEQVRAHKSKSVQRREAEQSDVQPAETKTAEELKAETDALLQEIDDILADVVGEGSAQIFVDAFQQKGGE